MSVPLPVSPLSCLLPSTLISAIDDLAIKSGDSEEMGSLYHVQRWLPDHGIWSSALHFNSQGKLPLPSFNRFPLRVPTSRC